MDAESEVLKDLGEVIPKTPISEVLSMADGRGRKKRIDLGPWSRQRTFLNKYALILVWLGMTLFFYFSMPTKFGRWATVESIFGSQEVLVFLGIAALTTLSVGEFDLSIASIMGISATIIPVLAGTHHLNIAISCGIAILACLASGALNAFFVIKVGVSSLIVTLGTGTLLIGISMWISDSSSVSISNVAFSKVALFSVVGLPISFFYGLVLVGIFAYMSLWTPVGRHMLFVGSNREVARLAGIRVNRVRVGSYLVSSVISGLGGLLLVSTTGGFDASGAANYLLPALAAVFLGTAVVQPGRFNPIGTLIGIYFLETGIFGLELFGYSGWVQDVFYGGGLVAAVAIATLVRKTVATS